MLMSAAINRVSINWIIGQNIYVEPLHNWFFLPPSFAHKRHPKGHLFFRFFKSERHCLSVLSQSAPFSSSQTLMSTKKDKIKHHDKWKWALTLNIGNIGMWPCRLFVLKSAGRYCKPSSIALNNDTYYHGMQSFFADLKSSWFLCLRDSHTQIHFRNWSRLQNHSLHHRKPLFLRVPQNLVKEINEILSSSDNMIIKLFAEIEVNNCCYYTSDSL